MRGVVVVRVLAGLLAASCASDGPAGDSRNGSASDGGRATGPAVDAASPFDNANHSDAEIMLGDASSDAAALGGSDGGTGEACGDDLDNDDDGLVDEQCQCDPGATKACYGGPPEHAGVGICVRGEQSCQSLAEFATWGECTDWVSAEDEICSDDLDNDCDDAVDEDCEPCTESDVQQCYSHPDGTPGVGTPPIGICKYGTQTCLADGTWGPCGGAVFAEKEVCDDGLDNDCNGTHAIDCVTDCATTDVSILIDITGSMGGAITALRTSLSTLIVPGLSTSAPDLQIGVASFQDFPISPYGGGSDLPFELRQMVTADVTAAQAGVDGLAASGGGDGPESAVEALYQAMTGAGIGPWVGTPTCPPGRIGHMCWRPGATEVILLVTDITSHNGPDGANPYSGIDPVPHTYAETLTILNTRKAYVLGIAVGTTPLAWLTRIATDTFAVGTNGLPIVFETLSDGTGLSDAVVEAIVSLCGTQVPGGGTSGTGGTGGSGGSGATGGSGGSGATGGSGGTGGGTVVVFFEPFEDNFASWTESGSGWDTVAAPSLTGSYPAGGSGSPVAHSNNCNLAGCWLELTSSIDLSSYATATLELARYIDSSVDPSEYLAVQVYHQGGWLPVFQWYGVGDNAWHEESIDLTTVSGFDIGLATDFRIRIEAQSSSLLEDIYVDDVRVTATP